MFCSTLSHKANQTEVSAALAGKVNKGGDTMTGVLSFSDIMGGDRNAQIIQWNGETHIRNAAGDSSDYHDIVIKPNGLYYSGFAGGVPSSYQIAPPAPPQEYGLPLAAGWADGGGGGASIYWKNQSMEVHVIVNVSATTAAAGVSVVAALPVGFRANRMYLFGCDVMASNVRHGGQSLNVTPDGYIRYFGQPLTAGDILWGHLCFVAH